VNNLRGRPTEIVIRESRSHTPLLPLRFNSIHHFRGGHPPLVWRIGTSEFASSIEPYTPQFVDLHSGKLPQNPQWVQPRKRRLSIRIGRPLKRRLVRSANALALWRTNALLWHPTHPLTPPAPSSPRPPDG